MSMGSAIVFADMLYRRTSMKKAIMLFVKGLRGKIRSVVKRPSGIAVLSCLLFVCAVPVRPQGTGPGTWSLMGGSTTVYDPPNVKGGRPGVYNGTPGVIDPSTTAIPGGRAYSARWIDKSGNLWLFGGMAYDANDLKGYLNDMWKLTPSSNQWIWMGGSKII